MGQVRYRIRGGNALRGTAIVQGSKNAALPMIAGALLASRGRTVLRNVPPIDDVRRAVELARVIGASIEFREEERTLVIDAADLAGSLLPGDLTTRFRGSVLFIPPLLHRRGEVVYEGVGGCNLGTRALDFHYRGFARLGARVEKRDERIELKASELRGTELYLDTPSHTGTENLILAACLAAGRTVIHNAALEPEVLDVVAFLTRMGAHIEGAGTGHIVVEGVNELHGVEYTVMPDRIDTGVLAIATAITDGDVSLVGGCVEHFGVARWKLEEMGVSLSPSGAVIQVRRDQPLGPISVTTDTYPGFATDLQSPLIALATRAEGTSRICERVHDNRFALADELNRMGARVEVLGDRAVVTGPNPLHGCEVIARDLRTGIALVLAGLVAGGETVITGGGMIDRGHAQIAERFTALGAEISREVT